ncbi:uncharacterized protein LOC119596205 [Penaeus monodon]|uniref:uncharacterized protein LOC119596205 n=1 Tax=Penaeus monodon TaxID=6687 RepID=UPI0018A73FB0|nr:uncharacterized protein LOC119596205 [Penaeus monodon]
MAINHVFDNRRTGSWWPPKPWILVQETSRVTGFASLLNALRAATKVSKDSDKMSTSSPESRLCKNKLLSPPCPHYAGQQFRTTLYNDWKREDSIYCHRRYGHPLSRSRRTVPDCQITARTVYNPRGMNPPPDFSSSAGMPQMPNFPNFSSESHMQVIGVTSDHQQSSCATCIHDLRCLPVLECPAMRAVALAPGVTPTSNTLLVVVEPEILNLSKSQRRLFSLLLALDPWGLIDILSPAQSQPDTSLKSPGTMKISQEDDSDLIGKKVKAEMLYCVLALMARVLVTLPLMVNSSGTRTTTGTMWYQVTVSDTSLEGAPSTTFDRPMTSLMCAGHALQATWGLFCHVDQLCRLYDVDIAGNFSESTATGLTICMTRIPPAQTPVYTNSPTTTTPSNMDSTAATPSPTGPTSSITPGATTSASVIASVSTAPPTTTAPPRSVTKANVFPTVALIGDLSSVNMSDVCENEGGFLPPYLYKAQIDTLFDTQESVAAWTTLVGEKCFGGDWILVWADGSRFRDDVTGYKVSAGSTAFGTQRNDSQRVCFALEGPEFVAHSCDGSTITTSMSVVCLAPPVVFKSVNETNNASYDSQDSLCRSEGGKLLPRLTRAVLKDLVYYYGKMTAWTTMMGKVCQGADWSLVWPDETRVDNETLDLPWSSGQTFFANASVTVREDLRVCFIITNSQFLVAHLCGNSDSNSVLCTRDMSTYLSNARTIDGSFYNQDALCAAEGGQAATSFNIDNLLELKYYYGSIKAWTTMLYEVSRAIIGWSRKEKWYDGKVVSVSKLDIPVNPSEEYKIEKTFCFVFKNTSMLVTQECFDNTTLMSALCLFV